MHYKELHLDNLKGYFLNMQYCNFFAPSDSRFSNSCISAKYCLITTNHTSMESLFMKNVDFEKSTLKFCMFIIQLFNSVKWFRCASLCVRLIRLGS